MYLTSFQEPKNRTIKRQILSSAKLIRGMNCWLLNNSIVRLRYVTREERYEDLKGVCMNSTIWTLPVIISELLCSLAPLFGICMNRIILVLINLLKQLISWQCKKQKFKKKTWKKTTIEKGSYFDHIISHFPYRKYALIIFNLFYSKSKNKNLRIQQIIP